MTLLTPQEVAARYKIAVSQVYRLTRDGQLPVVKLGRYYRYSKSALEAFENGETNTKARAV